MERYPVLAGRRTVPALRRGLSREQAMLYLLALAKEKPVLLNSVAALMKVTSNHTNQPPGLQDSEDAPAMGPPALFGTFRTKLRQRQRELSDCAVAALCGRGFMRPA